MKLDNFTLETKTITLSLHFTQTRMRKIALTMGQLESCFLPLQLIRMIFDVSLIIVLLFNHFSSRNIFRMLSFDFQSLLVIFQRFSSFQINSF